LSRREAELKTFDEKKRQDVEVRSLSGTGKGVMQSSILPELAIMASVVELTEIHTFFCFDTIKIAERDSSNPKS
jgi:hypothetical protein